jgi:hypothetical protein
VQQTENKVRAHQKEAKTKVTGKKGVGMALLDILSTYRFRVINRERAW